MDKHYAPKLLAKITLWSMTFPLISEDIRRRRRRKEEEEKKRRRREVKKKKKNKLNVKPGWGGETHQAASPELINN